MTPRGRQQLGTACPSCGRRWRPREEVGAHREALEVLQAETAALRASRTELRDQRPRTSRPSRAAARARRG